MASIDNKTGKTEKRELTPIQKILNTLYETGKISGEHHTVAQLQYDRLFERLKNLKEIYPYKYDLIKANASKRKQVPELSTMKDESKSRCPSLMRVLEMAVKLKEDQDGSARRELLMLLDAVYLEPHTRQKAEPKKELMKHGSSLPQQIDRCIDPNTIRMTTLWEFLSEKENMSALRISDQTVKLAREKYRELKSAWETILNREEGKVGDFLNSKDCIWKRSLSSLKIDAKDPLHIVMMRLSDARRIFPQKDDIIYEYVTLVDVCNTFRHLAAHTTKHVQSEAPSEKHLKTPAKLKSVERTGPQALVQESDVDCRSHLENLLQTYLEDKNVDKDDKERSRQEFMNLMTLRDKYGTIDDHVSKDDQVEEDKLENLVTEDQRGQAKGLYAVLRYAKEKGLKGWHWAAAEFSRLTDFVKGLGKTQEDHGARPKLPSEDTKQPPLFQLISSCKETDPTLRRKALDQYRKLRRKTRELPNIRTEQSMSRFRSPAHIPDDEQSSSYHVLQILRAADPDAKKYSTAWEEYFYLLADEQRFIQEQADLSTIFHYPSSSEKNTSLHRKAQALSVQDDWDNCLNEDHGLAEWKCINCDDFFCLPCKNIHKKGKKSRRHRLLHISKRETEDAVRREVFCAFHENKELDMYCITDKMIICTFCTVAATHHNHETEALDTYADKIRSSVGLAMTSADKIFPQFEERMENLNGELLNAKRMSTINRQHIESSLQEAVSKIKQNAANLLAEDERNMHILETSVTTEVDDLRSRMKEARSRILESRNFLESCSDQDLIKQAEVYIGKLDTIKEPKGKSDSDSIVHKMSGDEIQGELSKGLFSK